MGMRAVGPAPLPARDYIEVVTVDPATGLPVTGGGGGGGTSGGTASTAPPDYTNAATGQALSLTLKGGLRSTLIDSAGTEVLGTVSSPAAGTALAQLAAFVAALGGKSDASWTSGDGSVISVLKALASDTTAADTNLTKIGGTNVGASNPLFTRKGSTSKKRQAVFKSKTTILTGAQVIDSLFLSNQDAAVAYLQIFDVSNANTGTITLGTTAPDFEFDLNANQKLVFSGLNLSLANGFIAAVTTTSGGASAVAGSGITLSYTYN